MSQVSTFFDEDFSGKVNQRIRCLSLSEAKTEVETMAAKGTGVMLDISRRKVVHTAGADIFQLGNSQITLSDLHGLIFNFFYKVVVKSYCHAVREVLKMDGYSHLKGTHFEILFPSKIQRVGPSGALDYRLMELHSEPFILVYPSGETSFASLDLYTPKGIYCPEHYFPIMPNIILGKRELIAESNLVAIEARVLIAKHLLSIFTERQLDVLQLLARNKKSEEIAQILSAIGKPAKEVTKLTIETHRRDIRKKVKEFFPGCNDVQVAMILKKLGCL